ERGRAVAPAETNRRSATIAGAAGRVAKSLRARGSRSLARALLDQEVTMRTAISASRVGADEALLIGATGLLLILALTVEGESAIAYLVMAIPIVVGLTWWRPVYGFALLLGLAMLTEQFEINTMPESIKPMALQTLPIFENL